MLEQSCISLFKHVLQKRYEVRTDGEVAVFVRQSASLVTGKTDKMDTDHEASSAWTDLARWQKKDPETGPIVLLQTEYERWVGVKWLRNRWDQLEVGYVRNGLLYRWFISNSCNEEYAVLLVSRGCVEIVLYNMHIPAFRKTEMWHQYSLGDYLENGWRYTHTRTVLTSRDPRSYRYIWVEISGRVLEIALDILRVLWTLSCVYFIFLYLFIGSRAAGFKRALLSTRSISCDRTPTEIRHFSRRKLSVWKLLTLRIFTTKVLKKL